jgi:hypothetical protein
MWSKQRSATPRRRWMRLSKSGHMVRIDRPSRSHFDDTA